MYFAVKFEYQNLLHEATWWMALIAVNVAAAATAHKNIKTKRSKVHPKQKQQQHKKRENIQTKWGKDLAKF